MVVDPVKYFKKQGVIMREFPTWAQNHPLVKEIRQQPHNPGSFSVILLRRK